MISHERGNELPILGEIKEVNTVAAKATGLKKHFEPISMALKEDASGGRTSRI